MSEAATEILPGLLVFLALAKTAAAELRDSGMTLEILAVLAAVGVAPVGVIAWRATMNKLDERYMDKVAFSKLKAEVGDEMAEVRTSHQTLMGRWEALDQKVATLITDERHRDVRLERMETQLAALAAQSHKLEIDQLKGFSTLKDELRDHLSSSMAKQLDEIRDMVNRKL